MHPVVSSATFAAAFAVFIPTNSKSFVASAVDAAYKHKEVKQADKHILTRSHGEECSFASSGLRRNNADTGILGCAEDFVCVEDGISSLGGRCVSVESKHRNLQDTQPCDTKCEGTDACKDLSDAFIATIPIGSCCGEKACMGIAGTTTIGSGSCLGPRACYKATDVKIGNGSCTGGTSSCSSFFKGVVSDNSCYGTFACAQSWGNYNYIGEGSCWGEDACHGLGGGATTIGKGSCLGKYACQKVIDAIIGNDSCTGDQIQGPNGDYGFSCRFLRGIVGDNSCYEYAACYHTSFNLKFSIGNGSCRGDVINKKTKMCAFSANSTGTLSIGNDSCNEHYACYGMTESVGNDSCNGDIACKYNYATIYDNVCNTDKVCYKNSHVQSVAPTFSPTTWPTTSSAPTKGPTTSPSVSPTTSTQPSGAPTDSPTKSPTESPTTASPIASSAPTRSPTSRPTSSTAPSDGPTSSTTKSPTYSTLPTNPPTRPPTPSTATYHPSVSPTSPLTNSPSSTPTSKAPITLIPTSMNSVTTIQMDVTLTSNTDVLLTSNLDCSWKNDEYTINIIQMSVMNGMNSQLLSSGVMMLSIAVYQICGANVSRKLQTTESDIKLYGIATGACENCGTQMGQLAESALVTIVSDGSLNDSIKSNSGGTISANISGADVASFETISNPPTLAPTGTKTAKDAKNTKQQKPGGEESAKAGKIGKKN